MGVAPAALAELEPPIKTISVEAAAELWEIMHGSQQPELAEPVEAVESEVRQSSFDIGASVRMMRYDIDETGDARPETWQRVYDEEITTIAEAINRPLYSIFGLRSIDGQLACFDKGKWVPYVSTLVRGLETAEHEAQEDPRRQFLAERAADDLLIGYKMQALLPGQSMAWKSSFPMKEYQQYGKKFINDRGFQPDREMGFLYYAKKNDDGSVTLHSKSVDNSDEDAFDRAMAVHANDPSATIIDMELAYDQTLGDKYGHNYRAGRKTNGTPEEEAMAFIEKHKNVFDYYMNAIKDIAMASLPEDEMLVVKKRLTIGTWALVKDLLEGKQTTNVTEIASSGEVVYVYSLSGSNMAAMIEQAYAGVRMRGEMMFVCGGSLSADEIMKMSSGELLDLIFGSPDKKSKGMTMECVNCPKCDTFHDKVKPVNGKYHCKNEKCGLVVDAI